MKRTLKIVAAVLAGAVMAVCLLNVAAYRKAIRQQHRAERVLAVIVKLQPGVTSVADLQRDVFPLDSQFRSGCGNAAAGSGTANASYSNFPDWKIFSGDHTPEMVWSAGRRLILSRWTMFSVSLTCEAGVLTQFRVVEMQDVPGLARPYANSTYLLSKGAAANAHAADAKPNGKNYWVYEREGLLYEKGRPLRELPVLNRFIFVTPGATADERRRALDFRLDCFTRWSGCQDVNLMLQPAPNW